MSQINKLLKQAQKMQAQVMKMQDEMKKKEFEGTAGGGMVKIVINGSNELVSVKINPEVGESPGDRDAGRSHRGGACRCAAKTERNIRLRPRFGYRGAFSSRNVIVQ